MEHVLLHSLQFYLVTTIARRLHTLLLNFYQKESGWNFLTKLCSIRHRDIVGRYKRLYCFVRSRTSPLPTSNISLMLYTFWRLIGEEILSPNPTLSTVFKRLKASWMQGGGSVIVFERHASHTSAELSTILIEVYVIFLMCLGSCRGKKTFLQATSLFLIRNHFRILFKAGKPFATEETPSKVLTIKQPFEDKRNLRYISKSSSYLTENTVCFY
jgi:hypothetical protein